MEDKKNGDLSTYLWLWVRLVFVSVVALWLYFGYVDVLAKPVLAVLGITDEFEKAAYKPQFYYGVTIVTVVKFIVGMLFWWRAVKVLVLLGSPFKFGVRMGNGRENDGKTGRVVTLAHVGDDNVYGEDYDGRFWFGLIARLHPGSDKIVRSRLELLILALPLGWTLNIHEGRFMFHRQTHESRCKTYRLVRDYYSKTRDNMPPDNFRKQVVDTLKPLGQFFSSATTVKRIDGLNWHSFMGGEGLVLDDFGYQISYESIGDGERYKVTDGQEGILVNSVDALRELAKSRLHPTGGVSV